jgi:hypothetical protein
LIERFFPKERKEKRIGGAASKTFLWERGTLGWGADNGGAVPSLFG